ncbi:MAG: YCF48-related protein [Chlorobi bacterium]|nr:YCF48-related protein [Chlorobiota bacterium]MCI0716100.1 YCF48-related protein [Chlorobiota bacterium]
MKTIKIFCLMMVIMLLIFLTNKSHSQWFPVTLGASIELRDVYFINPDTGFVCGENGIVRMTQNGGSSWFNTQNLGIGSWTNSIFFINSVTGFIVGSASPGFPIIRKTVFGGFAWNVVFYATGTINNLHSVHFPDPFTGYAVGSNGAILKTTNAGSNWFTQTSGFFDDFNSVFFTSAMSGVIVGYNKILLTTNGGDNWTSQTVSYNLKSVYFISPAIGFASGTSGSSGILLETQNGGSSWMTQTFGAPVYELNAMFFTSSSVGYAVGGAAVILKTVNGGANWSPQVSGVGNWLRSVYFVDASTGFVVGTSGTVLKTTNGGGTPVGIQTSSSGIPEEFSLLQNYPNPFNPSTVISYQLADDGFVTLKIYDVLGKEVAVLVNEELKAGSYETKWNAGAFTSGIYFYKLQSGEFSETKKMILIK